MSHSIEEMRRVFFFVHEEPVLSTDRAKMRTFIDGVPTSIAEPSHSLKRTKWLISPKEAHIRFIGLSFPQIYVNQIHHEPFMDISRNGGYADAVWGANQQSAAVSSVTEPILARGFEVLHGLFPTDESSIQFTNPQENPFDNPYHDTFRRMIMQEETGEARFVMHFVQEALGRLNESEVTDRDRLAGLVVILGHAQSRLMGIFADAIGEKAQNFNPYETTEEESIKRRKHALYDDTLMYVYRIIHKEGKELTKLMSASEYLEAQKSMASHLKAHRKLVKLHTGS